MFLAVCVCLSVHFCLQNNLKRYRWIWSTTGYEADDSILMMIWIRNFLKNFFIIVLISNTGGVRLWQMYVISECYYYTYSFILVQFYYHYICILIFVFFRMHYVSKDCDTRVACESKMALTNSQCKRDWYDDWACIECCTGDMCNYYVTLTASSNLHNTTLLLGSLLVAITWVIWT